jgi:hypothetical protein
MLFYPDLIACYLLIEDKKKEKQPNNGQMFIPADINKSLAAEMTALDTYYTRVKYKL